MQFIVAKRGAFMRILNNGAKTLFCIALLSLFAVGCTVGLQPEKNITKTGSSNAVQQPPVSVPSAPMAYKDTVANRLDLNNPGKDAQHPKYGIDKEPLRKYFDHEQHKQNLVFTMNAGEIPLQIVNKETGEKLEGVEWFLTDRQNNKTFTAKESESNALIKIKDGKLIIGSIPHNTKDDAAYGSIIGVYKENEKEYLYRLNYRIISKFQEKENENLEKLNEKVAEITKDTENLSEYEKVQYVHDYLVNNIVYDYEYRGRASPYLSLVKGRAVCEGYARAFKHLMDAMGVVSEYESGPSAAGYHAWDIVKIEDGWYYLDPTWGRYQAFTKVEASNLEEVEVFLEKEPYPINLTDALAKLGYTADQYLKWKNQNSSEYNIKKAIEILEKILRTKATASELEKNLTRNYNFFLIDPETFHNTHGGATKHTDGRSMGTKHINTTPNKVRDPIYTESTSIEAPTEVKLRGISNTKGMLTNLNGKTIEYFMHNGKAGWQTAVEGAEITIDTFYGSFILLREKTGGKYSKLRKITPFWQDQPKWIKVSGNTVSELSGTMEYRKAGETEWKGVTDTEMTFTEKGSYEFRLKGGENLIPSQAFEVEIKSAYP